MARATTPKHNLQSAAEATGNGSPMPVEGLDAVALQVTLGGGTASVTWQASVDGTNYVTVQATDVNANSAGSVASADGLWRLDTRGLSHVRGSISAYTSGTITVLGKGYGNA